MFKTIVAFPDLCRSSAVRRPEPWRCHHVRDKRMYHGVSRFLKSWRIGTKDRDSVTEALVINIEWLHICCWYQWDGQVQAVTSTGALIYSTGKWVQQSWAVSASDTWEP